MKKVIDQWSKNAYKLIVANLLLGLLSATMLWSQPIIIDHSCTDITRIPEAAINQAKSSLHIAYGHTSHGSQVTDGMSGLVAFVNGGGKGLSLPSNIFAWNNGGTGGALDLHDYAMGGDVGYYPDWYNNTVSYLGAANPSTGRGTTNPDVNVIMWSWCGQASSRTEETMLSTYLTPMTQLETDYWDVTFVYMTGHSDGSGLTGNLHLRNQQIRNYCIANSKVLFDFYDIECYNPDGDYFGDQYVDDACNYSGGNWATEWRATHTEGIDWYSCSSAHSDALNANQKAYAIWWLWATLGGWDSSLPVHMGVISASANRSGEIVVRWNTQSETDCAGFHVWRSAERSGDYVRLTTQLISGKGNTSQKQVYEFVDRNAEKGTWYWYRIEEISTQGESELYEPIRARGLEAIPETFSLNQNFPNPFNPTTTITYQLAEPCQVEMDVVNIAGQAVRSLVNTFQEANQYTVIWDGKDVDGGNVPSGIYLVTLKAGDYAEMRKMSLMR